MLQLIRLLVLISVAFLAAGPVMACCLTGHGEPAVADIQTEEPPCHGEPSTPHQQTVEKQHTPFLPADCPGGFDCDSAMMQAHTANSDILLAQPSSEIPLATLEARFVGFEQKAVVLKTGPPGDPPPLFHTPISLKQRLLI